MRLLNVKTGLLEEILNPLTHKYAILSHMWGDEEVSFSDMTSPCFKLKEGYKKIKMAMKLANEAGLRYVWIDTCCIDKSSSAELTEAINSMYRWHWNKRGAKEDFIEELSQITKISKHILGHEQPLSTATVAQRMSWAAGRNTTRVEDQAYCLLGIFDVNMPLLYGEEEKAFQRLQYEIIGRTADLSIFAWCVPQPKVVRDKGQRVYCGILAASPDAFANCTKLSKLPHRMYREFSVSNIGIRTKIQVLSYPVPEKRGAYTYVLPLDCMPDSETFLGIKLRKCGPDIFVREDPWTLFQHRKALEPNAPRARHVLTKLPETDLGRDLHGMCSGQAFARMRPLGLQIQLPPEFELLDAWPWSRYDEEDNLFIVSGDTRYDSGAIRFRGTLETLSDGRTTWVDIDYMFYVVGWASSDPDSLQYSFIDYGCYKDAVNGLQTQLNTGDHNRSQLLYEINKADIPRFQEATKKVSGTRLTIHFSAEPVLHHDDLICSNPFWKFTFSYRICEDEPRIKPLQWVRVNRSLEEDGRVWSSLWGEYEF